MSRGFEIISEEQIIHDMPSDVNLFIKAPRRGTKLSAGYDILVPYDFVLEPGGDVTIPTGIKAYMNQGEMLVIVPRSGLGFKYYARLANTCGIVDADYYNNIKNEGHIFVKIRNEGNKVLEVKHGEAFCQAIFMPFLIADNDNFDNGEERVGGFGSTS